MLSEGPKLRPRRPRDAPGWLREVVEKSKSANKLESRKVRKFEKMKSSKVKSAREKSKSEKSRKVNKSKTFLLVYFSSFSYFSIFLLF